MGYNGYGVDTALDWFSCSLEKSRAPPTSLRAELEKQSVA